MMANAPLTRASLLERLRDLEDEDAWAQFVHLYAPLVYGYFRKRGLQDADAADLTQDVLRGAVDRLVGERGHEALAFQQRDSIAVVRSVRAGRRPKTKKWRQNARACTPSIRLFA
jgi:hypothetical protein